MSDYLDITGLINNLIPNDLGDLKLPDPDLLAFYRNYGQRKIYIFGEIDSSLSQDTQSILNYNVEDANIPPEERKPIIVYINSPGGDLTATYQFISVCEASKTPIITVNMGMAYSGGGLVLLAGHKRYALKRTQAMIHQGSGVIQGSYDQINESQKSYKKDIEEMKKYVLERTKIDEKTFNKNKTKDWYFDSDEQLQNGIVDAIVTSLDEII